MRLPRLLASTSVALLVATAPALAAAYLPFPDDIRTHLNLSYTPPCTICHDTLAGGLPNTIVHPFGQAMLGEGVQYSATPQEIGNALDDLAQKMNDSDCNKIPDIQQLRDGRDPNPPGEYLDGSGTANPNDEPDAGCTSGANPVFYGCSAQLAPAAPAYGGWAALVTALVTTLGLALARRRREPRPLSSRSAAA